MPASCELYDLSPRLRPALNPDIAAPTSYMDESGALKENTFDGLEMNGDERVSHTTPFGHMHALPTDTFTTCAISITSRTLRAVIVCLPFRTIGQVRKPTKLPVNRNYLG